MNKSKLNDLIKDSNLVIPFYLLKSYKDYNLNMEEFVFLMYLSNKKFTFFDPEIIANDLDMDIMEVYGFISVLGDKGLVTLTTKKENGVMEEVISLDNFYEKVNLKIVNNLAAEDKSNNNSDNEIIFKTIEEEFNRKLTPMEREVVIGWMDENISNELIKEAIKEASLNGANNLRYIDKILVDWMKKGYKKKEDIKDNKKVDDNMEIYNCNWLDDEEEL